MKKKTIEIKNRFSFSIGIRFDLFFGLELLTDKDSRVHSSWKKRTIELMPKEFDKLFGTIGGASVIWPIIADILRTASLESSFEEILEFIQKQKIADFQKEILSGALHYDDLAEKLLNKTMSLPEALAKIPKAKQEWLEFINLFPYQKEGSMFHAMELLIHEPEKFRSTVVQILKLFWNHAFHETWKRLQPQLKKSVDEKERLFASCTFKEFAKQALLRIEVDEQKELIKAVRGGAEDSFKSIKEGFFIPSFFNDKRYWTAFHDNGKTTMYFPYFDPTLTLDWEMENEAQSFVEPEIDPALIFKALGDPTRYAMVKMIAAHPKSSVEMAKILSVSKPTISHHVHILRDAGLLNENFVNGSVYLTLKKEVFENLSKVIVSKLFGK